MSCLTCSNCGFVDFLPPEPQLQTLQTIQSSDNLISQVLRGSRALLDSEHASMKEEIAKLEPLRSWYDVQLQEIQLRRHAVLKALENRESIYVPIRRLPRDILVEIFHSVCDIWWQGADEDELRDSLDLSGPLWALEGCITFIASVLGSAYLERTGEHPLSLMIINDSTCLILDGEIIPLLVQSCHRWKNVRVRTTLRHTHYLDSISHLPVLQTIEIDITDDDDYCSNICLNAPRLWQATLPSQGISQVRLPPGITHYSGHITCAEDLQLLSQLPKLRTYYLESSWMSPASIEAPVVMAELRELYVQDLDILKLLTAPILQSLTITADIPKSLSNVTLFFHRSGCRLESFSICMDVLGSEPPASIGNMFSSEACSTISHLKLELGSVWYNITRALASSSILPNLHRLILCFENQYFRHSQTERLPLLDMIRSRRDAGLKTIEVQFNEEEGSDFDDRDVEADIRILIGDNLEMRVEKWSSLHLDHRLLF